MTAEAARPVATRSRAAEPGLAVRRGVADDYEAFAALFPELHVDDPVPARAIWESVLVATAWVAEAGGAVVGYCTCQEYADTGYVRNVVVSSPFRQRGVGRALMAAVADHLRAAGKTTWRLNVMPENAPALALYAAMGMRERHAAVVLRLPWGALGRLPRGDVVAREISFHRDAVLERAFELPRGQLDHARALGRLTLEAVAPAAPEVPRGLAVFDAAFPGAFPFRVDERADGVDAAVPAALLAAIREHVPSHELVNLVIEDDERLASLLTAIGATVRHRTLHLEGLL